MDNNEQKYNVTTITDRKTTTTTATTATATATATATTTTTTTTPQKSGSVAPKGEVGFPIYQQGCCPGIQPIRQELPKGVKFI